MGRTRTNLDISISKKVEELRVTRGMSRGDLAKFAGVTHQQMGKYCKGTNRITAGRLAIIAKGLRVHITYFYDELTNAPVLGDRNRLTMEMARAFDKIECENQKESLLRLAKTMHN